MGSAFRGGAVLLVEDESGEELGPLRIVRVEHDKVTLNYE